MLKFLWTMSLPREMKQLHRHNVLPFQYSATRIPQSIHHRSWYLCAVLSCRAGCQQWLKRNLYDSTFRRQSKTNFHHVYYRDRHPLRGKSHRSSSLRLFPWGVSPESPPGSSSMRLSPWGLSPENQEANEVIICQSRLLSPAPTSPVSDS